MRTYNERLWVPWTWWMVGGGAVVSAWLVLRIVSGPWPWIGAALAMVVTGTGLAAYGAAPVSVGPNGLRAGKAVLPLTAVGEARALSPDESARLRGRDFDPQAYHLIRSYVSTAVRVEVADSTDPTPYWYIATRHPDLLVSSLAGSRQ
jgi:Protein of unknown function (DUF3093)